MSIAPDYFSGVAAAYASCRPAYPAALFDYLATLPARRELAWDCGAGSGQASVPLAARFQRVVATDSSAAQLAAAPPHARITCRVAPAGASGLGDDEVDLVVAAQALHWFDLDAFYAEVERVLRGDGYLAVWTYGLQSAGDATIDALLQRFYRDTLGPYWLPERRHVDRGYRSLRFPYRERDSPAFAMEARWTANDLLGYVRTWSAVSAFIAARGGDPVDALAPELKACWGTDAIRLVAWPLTLRVGRR